MERYMNTNKWVEISNTFSPFEPVPIDKLGEWYVERPDSLIKRLTVMLTPDRIPQRHILIGQISCGKSSELNKLNYELTKKYDNSFIVGLDLLKNIDVERVNSIEVLFLMGAALYKLAKEILKENPPDRKLFNEFQKSLEKIVQTHTENKKYTIEVDELIEGLIVNSADALIGSFAGAAVKTLGQFFRFSFGLDKEVVKNVNAEPDIERMITVLNSVIEDVENKAKKKVIFLVDGLDKLRDIELIRLNFIDKKFLNGPKCHVIYTGPLDLYHEMYLGNIRLFFPVHSISNIKLFNKEDNQRTNPIKESWQFMKDVVEKRLQWIGYTTTETVITQDALDLLIKGSGGVMRDFIRLIQDAAVYAEIEEKERIEVSHAKKVLNELRRQLSALLTTKYKETLDKVRQIKNRVDEADEIVTQGKDTLCDILLRSDIVLSYINADIWYDAHSALNDDKPW